MQFSVMHEKNSVAIVGGGMVGLVLAALCAKQQMDVAIIELNPPNLTWSSDEWTGRVSAVNAVSQQLLKTLDIWHKLPVSAVAPLRKLDVWDTLSKGAIQFDSVSVGKAMLGAIVENRALVKVLWETLQQHQCVKFYSPAQVAKITVQSQQVEIKLVDQGAIKASCVVGADGAHSWLRQHLKFHIIEKPYNHHAIIGVVKTQHPHQFTGWQAFLPDGVLALLPLGDDVYHCAMVWSCEALKANRLMRNDDHAFEQQINDDFGDKLGRIQCETERAMIPLTMRRVKNMVQSRVALIGDAAHTIHPLAGQGVNLGFMDAAYLAQCFHDAAKKSRDIGHITTLRRFERARKSENDLMQAAMCGFKEIFALQSPFVVPLRSAGLSFTNRIPILKNTFIEFAMGYGTEIPALINLN